MRYARIAPALFTLTVLSLFVALYVSSASAGGIVVTRDDDPAINGCTPDDCSFREAIVEGNTNGGTIKLGSRQISLSSGAVKVSGHFAIEGDGPDQASVGGGGTEIIHVAAPGNLTASGFKVTGGNNGSCGGGIFNEGTLVLTDMLVDANHTQGQGGGVCNKGTLTVTDSTFSNNTAMGNRAGGGIYNAEGATLSINSATVSHNTATGTDGGGNGAGITNDGTATIQYATIDHNTGTSPACDDCSAGAGIENGTTGVLTLEWSTISNNTADTGSGLENRNEATVRRSTFTGNTGGAIVNSHGSMSISISTIAGNSGSPYPDNGVGGISNYGTLSLTQDTIANNTAMQFQYGGLFNGTTGSSDFKATIFANNGQKNCATSGIHTSAGFNVFTEGSCGAGGSDQIVADAMLGSLQDNGGPTPTILPNAGSPAIDHGGASCPGTDQRGAPHVNGCDAGSAEFGSTPPTPTPSPTPTPPPIAYPMGDITCSDSIEAADLIGELNLAVEIQAPDTCGRETIPCFPFNGVCNPIWADTNCDVRVTAIDALPVVRKLAGLPMTFVDCPMVGDPILHP